MPIGYTDFPRSAINAAVIRLLVYQARQVGLSEEWKLEARDQPAAAPGRGAPDARRQPRFKLEVDIRISSKTCGVLKGQTVDLSESGVSALLKLEVPVGEFVELQFTLPLGAVSVHAIVRQRSAFRYGFQFVETHAVHEVIQNTCRSLRLEQSLFGE